MADQTKINTSNGRESPPQAVARSTAEFVHDILTLAELQGRLLLVDARSELRKLIAPAIVLAVGAVIGLSCVPLALVLLALTLVETTELTHAQAFGVALLTGLGVASILLLGAVFYLRSSWTLFERSRNEWQSNVQWAKDALRRASRGPRPTESTSIY